MRTRRTTLTAAAIIAALAVPALSACTSTPSPEAPSPSSITPRPADTPKPQVADTAPPSAQKDAVDVADRAMAAFVQRNKPYDAWWKDLSPFLTPDGLYAFEYTDPRNVPASKVTGTGQVSAAPSATSITVLVPTDIGQYQVTLDRRVEDGTPPGPWLVDDFTPPEAN